MFGLYSMPSARAPRLAAVMTGRPSPEPRAITKSCGVTFAMSSILSTSAWKAGTQTTVLRAGSAHEILRRDFRHVEHLVDERLRGRNPHHIFARLADLRFEGLLRS